MHPSFKVIGIFHVPFDAECKYCWRRFDEYQDFELIKRHEKLLFLCHSVGQFLPKKENATRKKILNKTIELELRNRK